MLTSPVSPFTSISDYKKLEPIITQLMSEANNSQVEILFPIEDMKVNNIKLENRKYKNGLGFHKLGLLPFKYTVSDGMLMLNYEEIPFDNHSLEFEFNLDASGKNTLSVFENQLEKWSGNLLPAATEKILKLRDLLKSNYSTVKINYNEKNTTAPIILNALSSTFIAFVVYGLATFLSEHTYNSVDSGGRVFFILLPLAMIYGGAISMGIGKLAFWLPLALIFLYSLWSGFKMSKKAKENIKNFKS